MNQVYPGDEVDYTLSPIKESGYETLAFQDPAELFLFFNDNFSAPKSPYRLWKWQTELLELFGRLAPTSLNSLKLALRASNGSGKDSIIICATIVFFLLCRKKFRIIITSSSGQQLTAQTETPIRQFCELINKYFDAEYIRIRQRYISCRLSGSEIRLFATDEAGKAEGYHPMEPGAGMAIVLTEWKSISDEIVQALRRCTGYNYWLGVSTPGEPLGSFYKAATTWNLIEKDDISKIDKPGSYTLRITSYDCPHIAFRDIEEDKNELGEHSAFFRSKHLALFTYLGGEVIISGDLIEKLLNIPVPLIKNWPIRIGIDIAAGGDENCIIAMKGSYVYREIAWRESDTTITADRIERELLSLGIDKSHEYIWADDGGIGHSVIDMLVRKGWNIKRVLNQWQAINKRNFGNRGAENWYRCKRFFEEGLIDVSKLSEKCREQLGSRRYKQQLTGARVYLESKKEAIANGRPSPDRADALILSLTGLTVDDYLKAHTEEKAIIYKGLSRGETVLKTEAEMIDYHEEKVRFGIFNGFKIPPRGSGKRIFNSLKKAICR